MCPNCFSEETQRFYETRGVPVHSVLLMPTREEATAYRRGDIVLEFCRNCGFIFNSAFDASVHEYSGRCEETQAFSPTFRAFSDALARRMVDRYGLRRKDILEIGCGKGEFLAQLCRLGDNRGTGIDPAFVPERTPSGVGGPITFIRDFYSEKYAGLAADFVCCRHTLEHIGPTRAFLRMLRGATGDRDDVVVFFEVPDVTRILREGAFWDIYYEHCSYFSPGSLARLFRASGFDILELSLDYDDQYILLTARPAAGCTRPDLALEDDLETLTAATAAFERLCVDRVSHWEGRLAALAADGARTVVWGSGSKGVAFLAGLPSADRIEYVVDVNPHKQGMFMPGTGHRIVAPGFLADHEPDAVIVMNQVYCREIQDELDRLGVKADLLAV